MSAMNTKDLSHSAPSGQNFFWKMEMVGLFFTVLLLAFQIVILVHEKAYVEPEDLLAEATQNSCMRQGIARHLDQTLRDQPITHGELDDIESACHKAKAMQSIFDSQKAAFSGK